MSRAGLVWPASTAQVAEWPRLAGACGSLRHALALREASGAPAGRGLSQVVPISSRPTKPNPVSPVSTGLAYSHTFHVLGILLLPPNPHPGVKAEAPPPPWSAPTQRMAGRMQCSALCCKTADRCRYSKYERRSVRRRGSWCCCPSGGDFI